jgi:hypothetical protein
MNGVPRWVPWTIGLVSGFAVLYEFWALVSGAPTISRLIRNLAEAYRPVYWFGGIITGFLVVIELYGATMPRPVRLAVLVWIMASAHIFWILG